MWSRERLHRQFRRKQLWWVLKLKLLNWIQDFCFNKVSQWHFWYKSRRTLVQCSLMPTQWFLLCHLEKHFKFQITFNKCSPVAYLQMWLWLKHKVATKGGIDMNLSERHLAPIFCSLFFWCDTNWMQLKLAFLGGEFENQENWYHLSKLVLKIIEVQVWGWNWVKTICSNTTRLSRIKLALLYCVVFLVLGF